MKGLAARERQETALLVAHLAEFDTRDAYLRAGYSSLFTYCRGVLKLSDDEAYNRVAAARTARRFPVVLGFLSAGDLTVTTVRLLAPHLTAENHVAILESARGKRKADVGLIVASLSPRPDVPACVRKLPQPVTVDTTNSNGTGQSASFHCDGPARSFRRRHRTCPGHPTDSRNRIDRCRPRGPGVAGVRQLR
jgi:hypothetical protein